MITMHHITKPLIGIVMLAAVSVTASADNSVAIQGLKDSYFGDLSPVKIVAPPLKDKTDSDGNGLFWELATLIYEPVGLRVEAESAPRHVATKKVVYLGFADILLGSYQYRGDTLYQYPSAGLDSASFGVGYMANRRNPPKNVATLNSGKIAVQQNQELSSIAPNAKVESYYRTSNSGIDMLLKNRVDYIIDDYQELINQRALQGNAGQLVGLRQFNAPTEYWAAFPQGQRPQTLMAIWNLRLVDLMASGELEALYAKYDRPFPPSLESFKRVLTRDGFLEKE
jgi:polar amino acid transport system substrate-binding protein